MKSDILICIRILVFPIGILEESYHENEVLTSFLFDTRLLVSIHPKIFSTLLVEQNGRCLKRAFLLRKMRIKNFSWNIKPSM